MSLLLVGPALAGLGAEQLPEAVPGTGAPALQPHLRDREAVRRRRTDDDPGDHEGIPLLEQMSRGPHDAVAREVLAGLLERVDERVGLGGRRIIKKIFFNAS